MNNKCSTSLRSVLVLATLLLGAAMAPAAALAADTTFSGQATVVQGSVFGLPLGPLANAGPLPPQGGSEEVTLVDVSVPGVLTAQALHATTIGMGDASRSEASVADLAVTVGGNTIGADFLMARAAAFCDQGRASATGSSELVGLIINGQSIVVSGQPNQMVSLGGIQVFINEQTQTVQGNSADMTVTALHVIIPGVAEVIVSRAHADITCAGKVCPADKDFVTGGGWITVNGSKATFAVAGGIKNGGYWGHLTYIDHGSGMKVKGTGVTAYTIIDETSRHIEGTCEINGSPGTYKVDVADKGEPGRDDTFAMQLFPSEQSAQGKLEGGNIQLHTCK
jgi:hypothetical protein